MNNWYVITGGPCSGKTTLLEYLEKKGYTVYYEMARIYIDEELKKGKTLQEIRKDEYLFQKKVLDLKIAFEKKLPKKIVTFIDRGIPDSTAYMKLAGFNTNDILENALINCTYKKVFLLELLEYKNDYARTETKEEALKLEKMLENSYTDIKIPVIRIPKMSVKKRAEYILKNL